MEQVLADHSARIMRGRWNFWMRTISPFQGWISGETLNRWVKTHRSAIAPLQGWTSVSCVITLVHIHVLARNSNFRSFPFSRIPQYCGTMRDTVPFFLA